MYQYRKLNIEELKEEVKKMSEIKDKIPVIEVSHLEWILDGIANELQKKVSEVSEQYKESGGTPFNNEAKGIMEALKTINEFFCMDYETDGHVLIEHFNQPLKKK